MRRLSKHLTEKVERKVIISESPNVINVIGGIIGAKKIIDKSWLVVLVKEDVSFVSYGFGAPSLAMILEEVISNGVRCVVKLDKCKSLTPTLKVGEVVIAKGAIAGDGFTRSRFPPGFPACPDPELFVNFKDLGTPVLFYISDVYYGGDRNLEEARRFGASCLDYSTSALYALAHYHHVRGLSLGVIDENVSSGERGRLEDIEERVVRLGINVFERLRKVTC